jgi:glycine betaine catabolism A
MATFVKAAVPSEARTLPGRYYTSPEVYASERERIFADHWICVGREEQLPEAGSHFVAQVAGESLIVVRDAGGEIRAHFNVCRHRGTRLCEEPSGRFKGSIVCPYHAWTYGLDGRLMTARNMREVPDFKESDYPLRNAALTRWEGFIFINLADKPEAFGHALAPLMGHFSKWTIGKLREARRIDYDLACNWKLVFQNYSECYHCPLVHPQLDRVSPWDSGRNDLTDGPVLGGFMQLRHAGGSMTMSGETKRNPLPGLHQDDHDRVYYYTVFPSMLLSLHPDYVMAHYVTPAGIDRTRITCLWLFEPHEMARPEFDPSDAVEFWDMTNRQDWHVCELSQQGVSSRAYTPGPYSHAEGILHAFDRNYLQLMGA